MPRVAIITDPLSSTQVYPHAFRDAGVSPVAVLTGTEPPDVLKSSWHPENFDAVHYFDGDIEGLAETLRQYDPLCIVPGQELGVPLYEELVHRLLPGTGNVPELAEARHNKWAMANAVIAAGVPHLRQICSDDADEIRKWLAETGLANRDVVVKPTNSGGADDVHLLPAGADPQPLLDRMVNRVNHMDRVTGPVLVQEFAEGDEYLIDSYSVDGKHGLVDVCRYTKTRLNDRIGIYDRVDFLRPDDPQVQVVWPYTLQVLEALGFRNGCGHAEVMITPDGPRLIEIAERPAGGGHQIVSELATGDNHILRTVAHRVRGEFKESYELLQHLCGVFISAPHGGILRNAEIFEELKQLPTYSTQNFPKRNGDYVLPTEDITSFIAWVILAAPDEESIDRDYRRVKELEKQMIIEPVDQEPVTQSPEAADRKADA